jgi:hypothetical protein
MICLNRIALWVVMGLAVLAFAVVPAGAEQILYESAATRLGFAALDRGTLVVPILLPSAAVLIGWSSLTNCRRWSTFQFYELTHRQWREDTARLKTHLEQYFKDVLKDHISWSNSIGAASR